MADCLAASVDGFLLVDERADGTSIYVSGTPGWNEGGEVDYQSIPRGGKHGTFAGPVYVREHPFSIEGYAESPTHLASEQLERRMCRILAGGATGEVILQHDGDVSLWVDAHRSARVAIERDRPTSFAWRIPLVAPDSFRYGALSSGSTAFPSDPVGVGFVYPGYAPDGVANYGPIPASDGTVTVSNEGDAPAYPVFRVAGPSPVGGFSIVDVESGLRVLFTGVVPEGSLLVLDSRDGTSVLDRTADRSGVTVAGRWPSVGPGESVTYRFAPESSSSAAVLTVELISTYW